jgi:signal transduction histidine kinase
MCAIMSGESGYLTKEICSYSADNEYIGVLEQKNSLLFQMTSDPVLIMNIPAHNLVEANEGACKWFNYRSTQIAGKSIDLLVNNVTLLRRAMRKKASHVSGLEFIKRDGSTFFGDISVGYFSQDKIKFAVVFISHIVDEKQAIKDQIWRETLVLERFKTESAFFMGEEHERHRLAQELHGHLGPLMVGVKLGLEQQLSKSSGYISRRELRKLLEQQTHSIREARRMTSRLAEGYQYQEDINLAIKSLINKFVEITGMSVYCKADLLPETLNMDIRYHLIQIIEEGLTNVVKHADATKMAIRLSIIDKKLKLYMLDNGSGMNGMPVVKQKGLDLMRERAALLDGKLEITSVIGKSFKLDFTCPIYP